jgi:hypothetical protein
VHGYGLRDHPVSAIPDPRLQYHQRYELDFFGFLMLDLSEY